MKKSLNKSYKWILLSLNLFKLSLGPSLFLGMSYFLIYLIIPVMPSTQILGPITILIWPFVTVFILYFYFCVYSKKKFEASDAFKIFSGSPSFFNLSTAEIVTLNLGLSVKTNR